MSKHIRRAVAKKLQKAIEQATDPMVIAVLAGQLAKYLPKPQQPRRKRGVAPPINKPKEIGLDDLVAAVEKKRKGLALTEVEQEMVGAVERKRNESPARDRATLEAGNNEQGAA